MKQIQPGPIQLQTKTCNLTLEVPGQKNCANQHETNTAKHFTLSSWNNVPITVKQYKKYFEMRVCIKVIILEIKLYLPNCCNNNGSEIGGE